MKTNISKTIFLLALSTILFFACDKTKIDEFDYTASEIEIDEFSFILEAYVWRDFMPGLNNDSRMMSMNRLVDINHNDISSRFEMKKQFIILRDDIWESDYGAISTYTPNYTIENSSREGPEWDTGERVKVVCQFIDNLTGEEYRIMLNDQVINRTE
ncbi:MAG: hypothetical protein GQ527_11375 [Bacteroidales bacterium]|nr:hypothetical protein [Bacteroidales bacterium]